MEQSSGMAIGENDTRSNRWPDDDVILYDGVCVFCSRWIRFVAARDAGRFRFTAIQSGYGARLARTFGIDPADPDTNAVIHSGITHMKSDGALTVLSSLSGWRWTRLLFVVPKPLRDAVYSLVARNRYRIFGKYDACFVPDEAMRARVLE
jgi:predicted DCC family thiol-disulfide oxidoreductase YuxK